MNQRICVAMLTLHLSFDLDSILVVATVSLVPHTLFSPLAHIVLLNLFSRWNVGSYDFSFFVSTFETDVPKMNSLHYGKLISSMSLFCMMRLIVPSLGTL